MMKLSVTKFTPSQLLLIPAGKEGTAFTPYALAILAVGCVILFIVSVLQERGMKIRETLSGLSLPVTVIIYFCLLASIGPSCGTGSGTLSVYVYEKRCTYSCNTAI